MRDNPRPAQADKDSVTRITTLAHRLPFLMLTALAGGCPEALIFIPRGEVECVLDTDCGGGICRRGGCVPVPDAGPPPVDAGLPDAGAEDAGFSDAGNEDAGFEDAGFPDAGFPDAGPADAGFEDAGFVDAGPPPPPPPPQVLRVTTRPELNDSLAECFCASQETGANVDLALVAAAGGTCAKPTGALDCGLTEPGCACTGAGLGAAHWSSDGPAVEYRPMETFIANEEVVRSMGPDGALTVRASLIDDCLRSPASLNFDAMFGCFLLDCENPPDQPLFSTSDCVNYLDYDLNTCPNAVEKFMFIEMGWNENSGGPREDCVLSGPAAVRITVDVQGEGGFLRQFCTVLAQDEAVDAVVLSSTGDRYEVTAVSPNVVEVDPGTVCPPAQP